MRIPLLTATVTAVALLAAGGGQSHPPVQATALPTAQIAAIGAPFGAQVVYRPDQPASGGESAQVRVPRVIGVTVRTAREALLWDHLLVTTITATGPTTSSDASLVIDQSPRPGAVAPTGSGVALTIAGEPDATGDDPAWPAAMRSPANGQVAVPDLTNDTAAEAELTVRGLGLALCPPVPEPTSNPGEVGRVMGQSPPVGTVVATGTRVTVIVGDTDQSDAHPASVWQVPVRSVARVEPLPIHARPTS
ncbi:MAG: hypothetical protein QOF84_3163 [Streptomyces sp.]|nr:hypothetical protein [Streptomyces sp.]